MSIPHSDDISPIQYVSEAIIREMFNRRQLYQRMLKGELTAKVMRNSLKVPPPQGEPEGTLSQIVYYYDTEGLVAIVHQYVRPDGSLGASGLPDPKKLVLEGKVYGIRYESKK